MDKFQFSISFNEKTQTASSKAIVDCRSILTQSGYRDFTLSANSAKDKSYIFSIVALLIKLSLLIKKNSVIAIQYPLLSGNKMFKYFIKILKSKKVKFFCVIHDLDELRYNTISTRFPNIEAQNLNFYDCIIVHNDAMQEWLLKVGVTVPMISLKVFDYLSDRNNSKICNKVSKINFNEIAFAGNLAKSEFIYDLGSLVNWHFNLYGPNFLAEKGYSINNLTWYGSHGTDKILTEIKGTFGLIWDGQFVEKLDDRYGNYLKYNNPHKLSLYLAAGLPVIAPKNAAVAQFIKKHHLGILVNNLYELKDLIIDEIQYAILKTNVLEMGKRIRNGEFFSAAICRAEEILSNSVYL